MKNNKAKLIKYKRRDLIRRIIGVYRVIDRVNKIKTRIKVKTYGHHVKIFRFVLGKPDYVNLTFINAGVEDDKD